MKLPNVVNKAVAYLKRDFIIASSYQLQFLITSFNSVFILGMLFFIGKMVDPAAAGLERFGGDYFSFVLIGYGFYQYFQLAQTTFAGNVHGEQMSGCLETVLGTRTKPETAILLSSMYGMLSALLQLIVIFAAGVLAFGVDLSRVSFGPALLSFLLAVGMFVGFGILSASFILVLKKGDPFGWMIMTMNFIFGGAFFPLEQMPSWMGTVARFIPATYALDALRLSIMNGASFADIGTHLAVLSATAVAVLPMSLFVFGKAVQKAKRDGTMILY